MTYALAWKTKSEVFLAADTALTSVPDPRTAHVTESSFGQKHVSHERQDRKVEERILKLFLKKNIGLTFAGSYGLALRVVSSFFEEIDKNKSPREALDSALFINRIRDGESLQLVIGYFDDEPRILSFNMDGDFKVQEDARLVQIGNPLPVHKGLTNTWIADVSSKIIHNPEAHLSALLGIFQSYNLFSPQMERGIGGAFCGLYVDQTGGHWQPDILFMEYGGQREKHVSTCFRHDCLVINSPTIGQSRSFTNFLPPQTQDYAYAQARKAVVKGDRLHRRAEYEYIVMLAVETLTVTVIEMQRKLQHALIWLKHIANETGEGTRVSIFPKLRKIMSDTGTGLTVVSYIKPNIKSIPKDKITTRDIRYD